MKSLFHAMPAPKAAGKRLWHAGLAAVTALAVGLAGVAGHRFAQPASAPAAGTASATVQMLVQSPSGDSNNVFNGDLITYTLTVSNTGAVALDDLTVFETLPPAALTELTCNPACGFAALISNVPEPLGGSIVVSTVTGISWTLGSVAPGAAAVAQFVARVAGQNEGANLNFQTDAVFSSGGSPGVASANDDLTVRVRTPQGGQAGASNAPNWLSADAGGTISQDWGDFDRDGDLDLVLGSSLGATIYRNDEGTLVQFWHEPESKLAYGVRWADVDGNGRLELIVISDSADKTPVTQGTNYVYQILGDQVTERTQFTSTYQLVRMAVADMNRDGLPDLIASTNIIRTADGCNVWIFLNTNGTYSQPSTCFSRQATAAISAADLNNDGWPDVVLGQFPNLLKVAYTFSTTVTSERFLETGLQFLPYDFAIADYDSDGYLDLAAAFPIQREVRVYHNNLGNGFNGYKALRTSQFLAPLGLDWGNFSGSGKLELLVADAAPKVFSFNGSQFALVPGFSLPQQQGQQWSARAVRMDRAGALDLSLANRDRSSAVFTSVAPRLATSVTVVENNATGSVAFGDWNNDGAVDIAFGSGAASQGVSVLYLSIGGSFNNRTTIQAGTGPHKVAFADVTTDGKQDLLVSTFTTQKLYFNANTAAENWKPAAVSGAAQVGAFGDVDGAGQLDLLIASSGGPLALYKNVSGTLKTTPDWLSSITGDARAVAWADFDKDGYQDFAVAYYNAPTRVFKNQKDGTFNAHWSSGVTSPTTSVAWADFNNDGYPDLALGNYGASSVIYENLAGAIATSAIWASPTASKTVELAWGDWDNDGFPELALANEGERAQVFANAGSKPGQPAMQWTWTSAEPSAFSGVAWGDFDTDGDLDLAFSSRDVDDSGVYLNTYNTPTHVRNTFVGAARLQQNPPYVYVPRPGSTRDAYAYSTSEVLAGPAAPTVTVRYTVFDANGSRTDATNITGTPIAATFFEYSLDGGSRWRTASPTGTSTIPTVTHRLGDTGEFIWDAQADQAISDNARFRVRVVPQTPFGPVERAESSAISPPFAVRATTCEWPYGAYFATSAPFAKGQFQTGEPIAFYGFLERGSGAITFEWDFGDNSTLKTAQVSSHAYTLAGTYTTTLIVRGQGCPITREAVYRQSLTIGGASTRIFLPILSKPGGAR